MFCDFSLERQIARCVMIQDKRNQQWMNHMNGRMDEGMNKWSHTPTREWMMAHGNFCNTSDQRLSQLKRSMSCHSLEQPLRGHLTYANTPREQPRRTWSMSNVFFVHTGIVSLVNARHDAENAERVNRVCVFVWVWMVLSDTHFQSSALVEEYNNSGGRGMP